MKLFNSFLIEAEVETEKMTVETPTKRVSDDLVTVFGRHQPPHRGHQMTFDQADKIAGSIGDKAPADQRFYTSRSNDPKKNPLPFEMKTDFLKRMFPKHADKWDSDPEIRTSLQPAVKAYNEGYKNYHFVGGGDRRQAMEDLLRRYNGDLYNFDNVYSHSVGERVGRGRNPIANLSASKLRRAADNDDFDTFADGVGVGEHFDEEQIKELFKAIKMFGQKNEGLDLEDEGDLAQLREMYKTGQILNVGDVVESTLSGLVGTIHRRGANHLICVTDDGIMFKNFIHDVETV